MYIPSAKGKYWFIPDISIAPLQFTTTQRRLQLQHWYWVGVNTLKRCRKLRVKDLPKIYIWRLEWDSKLKAQDQPLSHHATWDILHYETDCLPPVNTTHSTKENHQIS